EFLYYPWKGKFLIFHTLFFKQERFVERPFRWLIYIQACSSTVPSISCAPRFTLDLIVETNFSFKSLNCSFCSAERSLIASPRSFNESFNFSRVSAPFSGANSKP